MSGWLVFFTILGLICGVTLLIFAAVGAITFYYLRKNLNPDPAEIRREYDKLVTAFPFLTADELSEKIIREYAQKTGIIGGLSGIGGFIIFLVTLPFDLGGSMILQMKMIHLIALFYGNDPADSKKNNITLVMGGWGASGVVGFLLKKVLPKVLGEAIPLLGGLVGFGVNWATTKSIGEKAIARNKGLMIGGHLHGGTREIGGFQY